MGTLMSCRARYQHDRALLLAFSIACISLVYSPANAISGNETERVALLQFKAKITVDPLGIMSSWNDSTHFCAWLGVTCGKRHQRVTILNLYSMQLGGSISPHIGNLSFLRIVDLSDSRLVNQIPAELGYLQRLEILYLSDNSLSGQIPSNISSCAQLLYLSIAENKLVGGIPKELGLLSKLQRLSVYNNTLTGEIPPSLGNLSSVGILNIARNNLVGNIPDALGRLKQLALVTVGENQLSGIVPRSFFNLSSVTEMYICFNYLQGSLPSDLFITLPNLQVLLGDVNQFEGSIPTSLSNASNLESLHLESNLFTGNVPSLQKLKLLNEFTMYNNSLGTSGPGDLNFLCSLINATDLQILDIGTNEFGGSLPECVGNLSSKLTSFWLNQNHISGSEPIWPLLHILDLGSNHFSGVITAQLILNWKLMMTGTKEQQTMPDLLQYYSQVLSMTANYDDIGVTLTFKNNEFELEQVRKIFTSIDLSNNGLHGEIPGELGNLNDLVVLNLSHNHFSENIPSSFGNLSQLESLDLSFNDLSGNIPQELANLNFLEYLNVSFNKLVGLIPTSTQLQSFNASSYEGNLGLHGPPLTPRNVPGVYVDPTTSPDEQWSSKIEVEWIRRGAEVGFPVGLTIFIGPLLYIKRWRRWYCSHLGRLVKKIMGREDHSRGRRRRSRQQQRH